MKKYWAFSLLCMGVVSITFFSCSNAEANIGEKEYSEKSEIIPDDSIQIELEQEFFDTEIKVDISNLKFFMPEEVAILKEFTSDSVIFFMDYTLVNYYEISNDTAFVSNFELLTHYFTRFIYDVTISSKRLKPIDGFSYPDNMLSKFSFLSDAIPFVVNTCVAECTEYSISFDLNIISNRTLKTDGNYDNEYLELLQATIPEYYNLDYNAHKWTELVWEYGGGSLLGNKSIYSFLKGYKRIQPNISKNHKIMDKVYEDALFNLLLGYYMNDAISIIEELKFIVNEDLVPLETKDKLQQLTTFVKTSSSNCNFCSYKKLQVNCATQDCDNGE